MLDDTIKTLLQPHGPDQEWNSSTRPDFTW